MSEIDNLGERGRVLFDALKDARKFDPAESVMLVELCRMADRLDRLDKLVSGEASMWASIVERHNGRSHTYELHLDDSLAEARQLAQTFLRLAGALKIPEAKAAATDGIDDLSRRRESRLSS